METQSGVVDGIKSRIWHREVPVDTFVGDAPTMLSHGERLMLYWLGKNAILEYGQVIIDAGCFLGGSTISFATGLRARAGTIEPGLLHSYDMFLAPNDQYSLSMIGERVPGSSVRDIFDAALYAYRDYVTVHEGDIMRSIVPKAAISILFVDVAKTREINNLVISDFFPKMEPMKTILIQQDFNDHSCHWVNASMEKLKPYFTHLCDESGSRVYLYEKKIPKRDLEAAANLSPAEEFKLLQKSASEETDPRSEYFIRITASWAVFEMEGVNGAVKYLNSIEQPQPWEGGRYIDIVASAMGHLKDASGLERYHAGYFAGANGG